MQFFEQFVEPHPGPFTGFTSGQIYKGYMDDPCNTDNAWREAEVWNIHYHVPDNLDLKIKDVCVYFYKTLNASEISTWTKELVFYLVHVCPIYLVQECTNNLLVRAPLKEINCPCDLEPRPLIKRFRLNDDFSV